MAEAILNHLPSVNRSFRAYSAGSQPKGLINPYALEHLARAGLPTAGLHSKSWDTFKQPGAPVMDFVITVCDGVREPCPVWPGRPATANWAMPDPSAVTEDEAEIRVAFSRTFEVLAGRIAAFASLPLERLTGAALRKKLAELSRRGNRRLWTRQSDIDLPQR